MDIQAIDTAIAPNWITAPVQILDWISPAEVRGEGLDIILLQLQVLT